VDYDPSKITIKKIIIEGKEIEIKIAPAGMHGPGYKPDIFRLGPILPTEEEVTEDTDEEDLPKVTKSEEQDDDHMYSTEELLNIYERNQEKGD
jgi:hypothetical protein